MQGDILGSLKPNLSGTLGSSSGPALTHSQLWATISLILIFLSAQARSICLFDGMGGTANESQWGSVGECVFR